MKIKMIETDEKICGGKPRIAGTRITVGAILLSLLRGKSPKDIVEIAQKNKIKITLKDVQSAVRYAVNTVEKKRIAIGGYARVPVPDNIVFGPWKRIASNPPGGGAK
jgi:uncharacterized protein (DUF433 family)